MSVPSIPAGVGPIYKGGSSSSSGSAGASAQESLSGIIDEMAKTANVRKQDNVGGRRGDVQEGIQEMKAFQKQQQQANQLAQEAKQAGDFAHSGTGASVKEAQDVASALAALLSDEEDLKPSKTGKKKQTFAQNLDKIGQIEADLKIMKMDDPEEQEVLDSFLANFDRIKNVFSRLKRADSQLKHQEALAKKSQKGAPPK